MKVKTGEAKGTVLNYLVGKIRGLDRYFFLENGCDLSMMRGVYEPSANWSVGGPIVEREKITLEWTGENWMAYIRHDEEYFGPTPLVAAMRVYAASKLGEEVEVPDELA